MRDLQLLHERTRPNLPYWSLTFERGTSSSDVDLHSAFAGIASLDPADPKNGWMTLSKYSVDDEPLGFVQTALTVDGFIVEILIETVNSSNFGFWKAGRNQPRGPLVMESREGLFQTFSKDLLSMDEVNLIFDYFYHQFMLHPGFKWRSILIDFSQSNPGASALKWPSSVITSIHGKRLDSSAGNVATSIWAHNWRRASCSITE